MFGVFFFGSFGGTWLFPPGKIPSKVVSLIIQTILLSAAVLPCKEMYIHARPFLFDVLNSFDRRHCITCISHLFLYLCLACSCNDCSLVTEQNNFSTTLKMISFTVFENFLSLFFFSLMFPRLRIHLYTSLYMDRCKELYAN